MTQFKLSWNATLSKDATEDNPEGEHIGQYSGYVTFDNLLFAQKASTVAGEQMFQQIIEHSSMPASNAAPEAVPLEVANDDTPELPLGAVFEDKPVELTPMGPIGDGHPKRMVPRQVHPKVNNKKNKKGS